MLRRKPFGSLKGSQSNRQSIHGLFLANLFIFRNREFLYLSENAPFEPIRYDLIKRPLGSCVPYRCNCEALLADFEDYPPAEIRFWIFLQQFKGTFNS